VAKRGPAAITICSTAFTGLGHAQARVLGYPGLPLAVIPHPFGVRTRDEVKGLAVRCAEDIARIVREPRDGGAAAVVRRAPGDADHPVLIEGPDEYDQLNKFVRARRWSDGLPVVPPTRERVQRMLAHTRRSPAEVIAAVAPGYGNATVERIAINAVLAGCDPEYLPVLIAAVEAVAAPEFNLQAIQATTNPVAVFMIVNGPVAKRLNMNSGSNCLGEGAWANATLGRALRLVLRNVGGTFMGDLDRATQGQPAKFTFCCAENEECNPWEPLHVERGFAPDRSTVTVVGAESALNMNTHAKDVSDLVRVMVDTIMHGACNDYVLGGGGPWLVFSPEHADILKRAGLSKADVKRRIWEQSKMPASRLALKDLGRTRDARGGELGEIGPDTLLPVSTEPGRIGIVVAGGPGTHSVYIPSFGDTLAVTREVNDLA
jgi:hypothetical protein